MKTWGLLKKQTKHSNNYIKKAKNFTQKTIQIVKLIIKIVRNKKKYNKWKR